MRCDRERDLHLERMNPAGGMTGFGSLLPTRGQYGNLRVPRGC